MFNMSLVTILYFMCFMDLTYLYYISLLNVQFKFFLNHLSIEKIVSQNYQKCLFSQFVKKTAALCSV